MQNLHKNPELAQAFADQIREQVIELGIAKDLGLDLSKPENLDDAMVHQIQDYMSGSRTQNIPYGLHAFGRMPETELRATTVDAIVSADRSLLPTDAKVLAADMDAADRRARARASSTTCCARCAAASCRRAAAASRSAIPTRTRPARTSTASIPTRCRSARRGSSA